ncbi:MAG: hypothetical protein ACOX1P_17315 [Thermoguttaceae bacterium]|jgi:hypothetical protein
MPSYIPAVGQADIAIHNGSRTEIKRFDAVVSAAGANTLIAAVAGKKFLLRSLSLRALGSPVAVHFKTQDSNAPLLGTDAAHPQALDKTSTTAPAQIILPSNSDGWAATAAPNKALEIVLGAAEAVAVLGSYIEID